MNEQTDNNIGRVINKLTAIEFIEKRTNGMKVFLWLCECGNTREALLGNVVSGNATQCKVCASNQKAFKVGESKRTHGATGTLLHKAWSRMISRVTNVYTNIHCCADWTDFTKFKADMGDSYFKGAALDRKDNLKNYNKDNCQWLTVSEHNRKTQYDRKIK